MPIRISLTRPVEERRTWLAERIVECREHYTLAQMFFFYDWATEGGSKSGRMTFEECKTWDTAKRLRRYNFNRQLQLPDDWQDLAPEFARIYNKVYAAEPAQEPSLFDSATPSDQQPSFPAVSPQDLSAFRSMIAAIKCANIPPTDKSYFDALCLFERDSRTVTFAVPSRYVMEYIEDRDHHLLDVLRSPFVYAFGTSALQWRVLGQETWERLRSERNSQTQN